MDEDKWEAFCNKADAVLDEVEREFDDNDWELQCRLGRLVE